jgi:hypothetical protein
MHSYESYLKTLNGSSGRVTRYSLRWLSLRTLINNKPPTFARYGELPTQYTSNPVQYPCNLHPHSIITMEGKEKDETVLGTNPEMDAGFAQGTALDDENETIKRDLESRHINMIAIAGMIVSSLLLTHTHTAEALGIKRGNRPDTCPRGLGCS